MNHPFNVDISAYIMDLIDKELGGALTREKSSNKDNGQTSKDSPDRNMKNTPAKNYNKT